MDYNISETQIPLTARQLARKLYRSYMGRQTARSEGGCYGSGGMIPIYVCSDGPFGLDHGNVLFDVKMIDGETIPMAKGRNFRIIPVNAKKQQLSSAIAEVKTELCGK